SSLTHALTASPHDSLRSAHCSPLLLQCSRPHRAPHSFPTRRSSDLARVSCMTTDTTPADHGRPVLGVEDPAELLAQTRLSLAGPDRKSTRLNSSHVSISYAVFCLKKKNK